MLLQTASSIFPRSAGALSQLSTRPITGFGHRREGARWAGWLVAALAAAALTACGGGGGSDAPVTPANQAPSVTLDAPAANASFLSTDTVHITATASDSDGTVARVEFLSDGVVIGQDTSAPFEFNWVNPPVGTHAVSVRATDNAGASTLSASRQISSAQPNQAPTVSIAAPANNFKANAPATVLLSANASDPDGSVAKVEFFRIDPAAPVYDASTLLGQATPVGSPPAYQLQTTPLTAGIYKVAARVTDNQGATATSGSVQVIINALPTVSITSPAPNATIIHGTTVTLRATASDSDGTISKVEFFLNNGATPLGQATRVGQTNEYTLTWSPTVQGTYSFTARATDNDGAQQSTGSVAVNVPANALPTVSITSPAPNATIPPGTTATLRATASDSDGTVSKVEFFLDNSTTPLGQATRVGQTNEYTLAWSATGQGAHSFTARATDNDGAQQTSGSVSVNVPNALPTVSITSPAPNATIIPGTTVTLRATASDSDGTISKVEFFNGTTLLGQAARVGQTNEYTLTWSTTVQGTYSLAARATDNNAAQQTSGSVSVNVPANVPPTPTLDDPVAGPNAPTTLALSASAVDVDGSIASVQFFNGATSLGNGTFDAGTSKWRLQVSIDAAHFGTYTITARATDNLGGQSTTPSKSVTIAANVPPAVNLTSSAAVTLNAGNAAKDITLTASASDTDGIAKVEFFNGATKLGEDLTSPYQFTWTGVAAGSYTITAKATDTVGSFTTSVPQTLVVTQNLLGPWSTLSTAQKAGITLTPDRAFGDPGNEAGAVMTAIGVNTVAPKYVAAMAQGLRKLADLPLAVTGTTLGSAVPCPEGGTIGVFQLPSPNERAIDLNNCKIGGFNFFGGGDNPVAQTYNTTAPDNQCTPNGNLPPSVPPAAPLVCSWPSEVKFTGDANNFLIVVKTLQVSGNGAPEALGAPFPHNAYGYGWVRCTVTNGVKSCTTSHENSFVWGNDLGWTNWSDNGTTAITTPLNQYATDDRYTLNGTLRPCQADPQPENQSPTFCQDTPPVAFHIKFDGMAVDGKQPTPTGSGRAIVYGSSDRWSVVTRQAQEAAGIERMTVQQFSVNAGVAVPATPNPLPYRCTVDVNGFYQCAQVP